MINISATVVGHAVVCRNTAELMMFLDDVSWAHSLKETKSGKFNQIRATFQIFSSKIVFCVADGDCFDYFLPLEVMWPSLVEFLLVMFLASACSWGTHQK